MGVSEVQREALAAKFEAIFPHLDERQRRLLIGAEARSLARGGIRLVARAAGVREATPVRPRWGGYAGWAEAASGRSIWTWDLLALTKAVDHVTVGLSAR